VASFLCGLFLAERRNLQQMAESQESVDRQDLQYLVSEAVWDHQKVQGQIAQDADRLLGGHDDSMLLLDESAFAKKGKHSAGVGRQWNGRLGKVDNCQVGVFAALCRGTAATLVQGRLYVPKDWTDDLKRCSKAGIPDEARGFRSKSAIALDMVANSRRLGLRFAWVGADAGYGKEPQFIRHLDDAGERFVVDVHATQRLFLNDPMPHVPMAGSNHGRKPTRLVTVHAPISVEAWAAKQPASAWQEVLVRHTTIGPLRVQALRVRAWFWDHQESDARRWTLLVIREIDRPDEISYTLTNAANDLPLQVLAQAQRQRFWIENTFGDAKSELGLGHYEVRSWVGWHRHMTLCMLAQLFITEQRFAESEHIPMLSTRDLCTVMFSLLTDPDRSFARTCQVIEERQRQRWDSQRKRYEKGRETPVFVPFRNPTM
jgi:SRSO17 transposase